MDNNPYTSAYAPAMMGQQNPVQMQNTQPQQQNMNQLMQQQNQMVQQAGQMNPSSSPMALATALRGMGQKQPQDGVSGWDNASAWLNSKMGRDEMQPNSPQVQSLVDQYYGSGVPNNWSA